MTSIAFKDVQGRTIPRGVPGDEVGWFRQLVTVLRDDKQLRTFVLARSRLLVSALSPPFVVALSIESGAGSLAGLGSYIVASGLAALTTVAVVSVAGFVGNGRADLFFTVV